MTEPSAVSGEFVCPRCGGHYFSTAPYPDQLGRYAVRCNGDSSDGPRQCGWRGWWKSADNSTTGTR